MRAHQPARTENTPSLVNESLRSAQHSLGNQAMQRLLERKGIQPKLEVTPPGDSYEQEAEKVANQVTGNREVAQRIPEIHGLNAVHRQADSKDDKKKTADTKQPAAKTPEKKPEPKKDDSKSKPAVAKDKKKDEKVSRMAEPDVEERKQKDEETAQRAAEGIGEVPEVSSELESSLHAQRGSGHPLPDSLRSFFEPRLGRDLSTVRLHTDPKATAAARDLKAQAFTHGQDIYFGSGRYQPQSDQGRKLIAHELTHTLQQRGPAAEPAAPQPSSAVAPASPVAASSGLLRSPNAPLVQRQGDTPPATPPAAGGAAPAPAMTLETGLLDQGTETISFKDIEVPDFKLSAHRKALYDSRKPLKQKKAYKRGDTDQRTLWKQELGKDTAASVKALSERCSTATGGKQAIDPAGNYIFKAPPDGPPRHFIGDLPTIATEMTLPSWSESGSNHKAGYDVDHIVELQLANWDADTWANTLENMELLDSSKNRSSGSTIKGNIDKKIKTFNQATNNQYGKSEADIKSKYHLQFNNAVPGGGGDCTADEFWTRDQIKTGKQIVKELQIVKASELGGQGKTLIFPGASGVPKQFDASGPVTGDERNWLKPYQITAKTFKTEPGSETTDDFGSLTFVLPKDHPQYYSESGEKTIPVKRVPGAQFAGMIDKTAVRNELANLRKRGLSPVTISTFDILPDKGLYVQGAINIDVPLLNGVSVDFEFTGNDLTLSKEFGLGDFNLPKPFKIDSSTLKLSVGTAVGLQIEGQVDFSIERVGSGFLGAVAGTTAGFALQGGFNFDSTLFDPAKIELSYINKEFSAKGEIGIKEGTLKGIKQANIKVSYANETVHADGQADLSIPGVKKGAMTVDYSEQAGLTIGGTFDLADNIPGISGGTVKAEVKKDDAGWAVKASGTASTSLAGFNTTLTATYDRGAMTVEATAAYSRGMLAGTLTVGATNRPVDDSGKPSGEGQDTDKLTAYGGGTVTVQLTPWLQGTVGVMIKPKGGVKLQGQIGLPSSVNLFDEKSIHKEFFSVDVQIPIIPGIVANVGGGLSAEAGFGPGQLKDLSLTITYDPDAEEDTEIEGKGTFSVPAHAGLRLFVRGGLGVGIPAASATGNLELGGQLGITGAAEASADVDYTPKKGIDLKADAHIFAEPALTFDASLVGLIKLGPITVYEGRKTLASFQWGSGLRFGIKFPIHYQQGQPFDVKLDDVEFEKPDIDAKQILSGVGKEIASRII